ncbi:MAG: hypothetical protein RJB15_1505, partial [Pseudomonadota bacterium]
HDAEIIVDTQSNEQPIEWLKKLN